MCVKMLNNLHQIAWLHWTVDLLQQFALIIRCLAHSLRTYFFHSAAVLLLNALA